MRIAARFAYAAALLFAVHLTTYFIPPLRDATLASAPAVAVAMAVLAIAQHLVVFPVAASLPAVTWARTAAYTWLIGDMVSDLMQLGGASQSLYLTLRFAVNILAALWIASASAHLDPQTERAARGVGFVVAGLLLAYSLAASFTPSAFLLALPALVLLPLWFVQMGQRLMRLASATPTLAREASTHTGD